VFFEKSTSEFKEFPEDYVHHFEQRSNTGLDIDLLQKYIFIPLDVFRERKHNKIIKDDLEAWLTFFSTDSPDEILRLTEQYPRFRAMYDEVFSLCANTERVMEMWSEELLELDRNTVQYMVDEMQEEITKQKKELSRKDDEINRKDNEIRLQQGELSRQKESLDEKESVIIDQQNIIKELQATLAKLQK
jgi:alkyl hydroperoxide reductase subunit AhpC